MPAPIARVDHGQDPYKWLEKRDAPEVLDHLKAENAWVEEQLLEQSALRETLYQEIKGRIRETDLSLPSPWGPWLYYQRTTAGDEYARHYRCPRPADGSLRVDESAEQLLLDPNQLAAGGFLSLGAFSISQDHSKLAYSLDTQGDEIYRLFVKDLASGAQGLSWGTEGSRVRQWRRRSCPLLAASSSASWRAKITSAQVLLE